MTRTQYLNISDFARVNAALAVLAECDAVERIESVEALVRYQRLLLTRQEQACQGRPDNVVEPDLTVVEK
jgi:hypothetical protein